MWATGVAGASCCGDVDGLWSDLGLLNLRGWCRLEVISFLETCARSVVGSVGTWELLEGVCVGATIGGSG